MDRLLAAEDGVHRRCPLWRETISAIRDVLNKRRIPKLPEHADLVFVTAVLGSFAKETSDNPIAKEFGKLVKELGLEQKGHGQPLPRADRRLAAQDRCRPCPPLHAASLPSRVGLELPQWIPSVRVSPNSQPELQGVSDG